MSSQKPHFLLEKPSPQIKQRLYNGRHIIVWEGKVKISNIQGWVENPRIDLAKRSLQEKVGNRDLSQEEIFDLMKKDAEVRLKELRDDIIKNGLREPLTLSFEGKLLDGNRRFFAVKYALETMPITDPDRPELEILDVYVLSENATKDDEQNVLVEENFSASLKIEWPDYVKAAMVVSANEEGLSPEQIAKKFNWSKSKVKDTLKINEIICDFEAFANAPRDPNDELGGGLGLTEQESQVVAAKNYQYFNEAQKSFFEPLNTDIDFKIQFFKWIYESKFSSFPEVRVAYKAWRDPEAKAILLSHEATAAKEAKAILDYNSRVVRNTDEAVGRIDAFVRFLKDMKVEEIRQIPEQTKEKLFEALELVIKMNQAASGN